MFNINDLLNPKKMQKFDDKVKRMEVNKKSLRFNRVTTEPILVHKTKPKATKLKVKKEKETPRLKVRMAYSVYITSPLWEKRRRKYFKKHGRRCQVCGSRGLIHLHHKYYDNFGFEKDNHLIALCGFHHEQIHKGIGKTKKDMIEETDVFVSEMKKYHKSGAGRELERQDSFLKSLNEMV